MIQKSVNVKFPFKYIPCFWKRKKNIIMVLFWKCRVWGMGWWSSVSKRKRSFTKRIVSSTWQSTDTMNVTKSVSGPIVSHQSPQYPLPRIYKLWIHLNFLRLQFWFYFLIYIFIHKTLFILKLYCMFSFQYTSILFRFKHLLHIRL